MPISRFILSILVCLTLFACASKGSRPESPMPPAQSYLPPIEASSGAPIYIHVTGFSQPECHDFEQLIGFSLQSERGLMPVDNKNEAEISLFIHVKDIYLTTSDKVSSINAGQALRNTALGTVTGMGVGILAGRQSGGLIGAGIGAAIGLGATLFDAGSNNAWVLLSEISLERDGEDLGSREHSVIAQGSGLTREKSLVALKDLLAQDIVRAFR